MIYVCIPSYNEAPTVGLLLWKVRQVFAGFPREYQLLVLDDGSTDQTAEVLEPYTRVLPLTVIRHSERRGYAASVEALLRRAVELTDRPKRDAAILMHADFAHNTQTIPDLVRRIESGADLVVAQAKLEGEPARSQHLLRRHAPRLLRGIVSVPGVVDLVSGFSIIRLVALRNAIRSQAGRLLVTDGQRRALLAGGALRTTNRGGDVGRAARPQEPTDPGASVGDGRGHLELPARVA